MEGNAVPALSRSWNGGERRSGTFQELECRGTAFRRFPGAGMCFHAVEGKSRPKNGVEKFFFQFFLHGMNLNSNFTPRKNN